MKILALVGFALSGAEAFTFRSVPRVAPHITGRVASQRFSSASYWPPAGATTGKGKQASSANADKKAVFEPLGRGIAEDVKRRLPLYASDFRDGLSVKSCAAMLFLAFASITPTIGFGSLLSTVTGGQMGVVEFLLAASLCGGSFALLGENSVLWRARCDRLLTSLLRPLWQPGSQWPSSVRRGPGLPSPSLSTA